MTTFHELMTENEFKTQVITYAQAKGWLVHHDRPAPDPRQGGKLRTVIEGDPGFPDLALARDGAVVFAELKSEKGKTSEAQESWLEALAGDVTVGRFVHLWRPSDLPAIRELLA